MIPKISNKFIFIVGMKCASAAAVSLSYVIEEGSYIPLFIFPRTDVPKSNVAESDIHYAQVTRAHETSVRIHNCIRALRGCTNIVFIGLDENQKTFLDFTTDFNCLDISDTIAVDDVLKQFSKRTEYLSCKTTDLYKGLICASRKHKLLRLDENAQDILEEEENRDGLIVIEDQGDNTVLIGLNYGLSIGANIKVINQPQISKREIVDHIENWKTTNDQRHFNDLSAKIYPSIEHIDFAPFKFATFFTFGIPYSLILNNQIPITNVNIDLQPDFFIFNNLYFEIANNLFSSIIFSPLEFGTDEETEFIINSLQNENYYVKKLIGKDATSFNIDRHVSEFPYTLLHFCSHGGEVDGFPIQLSFRDRDGNQHTVDFDEIVSFAPEPGSEMVQVTSKWIFRKFNGFYWKSKELKAQNYPQHTFADMVTAIRSDKLKRTIRKPSIPDSCAIKCVDFHYQAMFNSIAGVHSNPLIFNNTCWSNSEISHSFLAVGARGYIGTLWSISNNVAKNVAESFYSKVFKTTISNALTDSYKHTKGTTDENIYVFWGLHFAAIKPGLSIPESRMTVARKLLISFYRWRDHIKGVSSEKTRENIERLIDWNCTQLRKFFLWESIKLLATKKR